MKYCGIDLHSNSSVVSVVDEEDHVVAEKRLPNDLEKIIGLIKPWQAELAGVVVESTFNWYWLVDGLKAAGFTVHLANTTAIKKYDGLKDSGDEADARYLAHLLRLGILPTGTILPPEHRAVRDLARKRMQLVRSRTTHILAVENITARQYGARITSNQVKQLTAEMVDEMPFPNDVGLAVKTNVAVIETLSAKIDLLEKRLLTDMKVRPGYALLTSAPGIGKVLATTRRQCTCQVTQHRTCASRHPCKRHRTELPVQRNLLPQSTIR
jgi:transposase